MRIRDGGNTEAAIQAPQQITVRFSGPMLFAEFKDRVEVIIPRTECFPEKLSPGDHLSTHPDGSPAFMHTAWLAIHKPRNAAGTDREYLCREALIGADITLDGNRGPLATEELASRFDLTSIARHLGTLHTSPLKATWSETRVAARIIVRNGVFKRGMVSGHDWYLNDVISNPDKPAEIMVRNPAYTTVWEAGNELKVGTQYRCDGGGTAELKIQGAGSNRTFGAEANLTIDIANLDPRTPENWRFPSTELPKPKLAPFVDHDFKCVYRLFEPSRPWDAILMDPVWGQPRWLPAPTLRPDPGTAGRPVCHGAYVNATGLTVA